MLPEPSPGLGFEFDDLVSAVHRKIKALILNQHLRPGEKIKQEELARALGVSRTPIIKALHLLMADNLVTYTPRKGFAVKVLTTEEMAEIFHVRALFDGAVAREAARRATQDELDALQDYFLPFERPWDGGRRDEYMERDRLFHLRLYELAGFRLASRINEMFNISTVSYQRGLLRDPDETLGEHLAIVDALRRRDGDTAELLAKTHALRSRDVLLAEMRLSIIDGGA